MSQPQINAEKLDIDSLRENMPITTAQRYKSLNTLQNNLEATKKLKLDCEDNEIDPENRISVGLDLCISSHNDYWLSFAVRRLKMPRKTKKIKVEDMKHLKDAIERAEALPGCNLDIIKEAHSLYKRLTHEMHLMKVFDELPKVKLPIPDIPPDESRGYWREQDRGYIEKSEGFPLPPINTGEYIWIQAKSLNSLQKAIAELKHGIDAAVDLKRKIGRIT